MSKIVMEPVALPFYDVDIQMPYYVYVKAADSLK